MGIGCAEEYTALVVRQGATAGTTGQQFAVGEISEITSLEWNRILSSTSTCRIEFTRCPSNCGFMAAPVKPWAYELWIYRDGLLAWCGPIVITRESRERESFEMLAWDITGWTSRRRIDQYYTLTDNPTSIAINICQQFFNGAFNRPDPGFLPYVNFLGFASNAITVEYDEYQYTVGQKWVDLVQAGFNYTTVGRYTFVSGETAANVDLPYTIDATSIMGDMELVQDGLDFATRSAVIGDAGSASQGPLLSEVNYYGEVDLPTIRADGPLSLAQLVEIANQRYFLKRDMSPTLVIPSGSSLAANTDILPTGFTVNYATQVALGELMCGLRYDVQIAEGQFCEPGNYPMRLDELKVTWTPEQQERIAVSFGTLGFPGGE